MGYEDDIIRELYFTVYDASTGRLLPVLDTERVDVHRLPPTRQDFQQLEPSETVAVAVDLAHWYAFKNAGSYRIVFSYDNQFDGQEFGFQAFTGRVVSDSIEITLNSNAICIRCKCHYFVVPYSE